MSLDLPFNYLPSIAVQNATRACPASFVNNMQLNYAMRSRVQNIEIDQTTFNAQLMAISQEMDRRATSFYGLGVGLGHAIGTRTETDPPQQGALSKLFTYFKHTVLKWFGLSSIEIVINNNSVENLDALLAQGADPNDKIKEMSLLMYVMNKQPSNIDMVDTLLEYGADIDAADYQGVTPLMLAAPKELELVRCLLRRGANIDKSDISGRTALSIALREGNIDVVSELLSHGASPILYASNGKIAFEILSNEIGNVSFRFNDNGQITSKSLPAVMRDFHAVKNILPDIHFIHFWHQLIQRGFPISTTYLDRSPLSMAAIYGLVDFASELVEQHEVDVNEIDILGHSALDYAVANHQLEIISLLTANGAKLIYPTVLMVTDSGYQGRMYLNAKAHLEQLKFIPITMSVPDSLQGVVLNNDVIITKVSAFLVKLPAGINRAQAILESGIQEVDLIKEYAETIFKDCDGVWLSGGGNIWQGWYKTSFGSMKDPADISRDILEISLLDLQQKSDYKPLNAVCRGLQMINVFRGGTLRDKGEDGIYPLIAKREDGVLASALPVELAGWSLHGQSIDELGSGLQVVATSGSGMIKAIQHASNEIPLMGTQFHPESVVDMASDDVNFLRTGKQILDRYAQMLQASKEQTCFAHDLKVNRPTS